MPLSRYTLIIPTYNRPDEFGRLLRFLAYQKAPFQVLVLDSSGSEIQQRNDKLAQSLALNVRFERYDPIIPPWEKFWRGTEIVDTDYASFCADDDLVLVSSLEPLLGFLERNSDYSVAHGWYFNFYLNASLGLTKVIYDGSSIDENDPLDRLHHLFRSYEALTYGLHRTGVLKEVLIRVQSMKSMLGRELLGGAVAVVAGKVARLPLLYAGRSLGSSASYVDWHPAEFLLSSPQSVFDEYGRYRAMLIASFAASGGIVDDQVIKLVDLAHLRYAAEYFRPEVIDYLIENTRAGRSRDEIVRGLWPVLSAREGVEGRLERSSVLQYLKRRFFPWLRAHHVRKVLSPSTYESVAATTVSGKSRNFEVYRIFSSALASGDTNTSQTMESLMGTLRAYE